MFPVRRPVDCILWRPRLYYTTTIIIKIVFCARSSLVVVPRSIRHRPPRMHCNKYASSGGGGGGWRRPMRRDTPSSLGTRFRTGSVRPIIPLSTHMPPTYVLVLLYGHSYASLRLSIKKNNFFGTTRVSTYFKLN